MSRASRVTNEIKKYDSKLFCEKSDDGSFAIYRMTYRYEYHNLGKFGIISTIPDKFLVFKLTDNWSQRGQPVDWGIEPILNRLKAMDLWKDFTAYDQLKLDEIKYQESKERDRRNSIESFLIDFRKQFVKATDDIRIANMDTKYDRRRLSDGNR